AAGPEAGHVDRLSLLPRDVVVAESGRDPFPDRLRVGPSAKALGPPDRRPVQRPRLVRVSEAEAGLAVAADERAVRPAELVAFEPGEVPVLVGLGADVSQPHRQREAAAPDDLPRPHRAPRATAGGPRPTLSTAEPKTSRFRPARATTATASGGAWSRSGSGAASARAATATASTHVLHRAAARRSSRSGYSAGPA